MFSNKRNVLLMKNFFGISLSNSNNAIRLNLFNNGSVIKRFSVHVNNSHSDPHASENNNNHHDEHHDDHHGHHDITGEVDLDKVYVPLSADVI
jgi:hypothetical protein